MSEADSSKEPPSNQIAWDRGRRVYRPHHILKITGRLGRVTLVVQGPPEELYATVQRWLLVQQGLLQFANDFNHGLWSALRVQFSAAAQREKLKDLAAAAYRFIVLQEQLPSHQRNPALQRAQAAEAAQWKAAPSYKRAPDTPRSRRIRQSQFLVRRIRPDLPDIEPESFWRRYIHAGGKAHVADAVEQQLIAEGVDPRVQELLEPWKETPSTAEAIARDADTKMTADKNFDKMVMSRGSPCTMKIRLLSQRAGRPETSTSFWYRESATKLTWELPEPRIVAVEHAEQSREEERSCGRRRTITAEVAPWSE